MISNLYENNMKQNPHKSKLPVIYLLDSITKNAGPIYTDRFGKFVGTLMPAIFDLTDAPEDRAPIVKLLNHWKARSAFHPEVIASIQSKMEASEQRRAIRPVPSGWPPIVCIILYLHVSLYIN